MNVLRRIINTSVARQSIRKCYEEKLPPTIELKGAISAKFQVINQSFQKNYFLMLFIFSGFQRFGFS